MGLAPNFATVFVGDSIGCEVPDPILSQPLSEPKTFPAIPRFSEGNECIANRAVTTQQDVCRNLAAVNRC